MRLPEVAVRLRQLSSEYGCNELNDLADEIGRRQLGLCALSTLVEMSDYIARENQKYS